jgi:type IV secretory pathway TraG/TraD family ATPase VirD4
VGASQSGKTSGVVIPAILEWRGPVVVTSVKRDVVASTARWRATRGEVQCLEPGRDDGLTWDPLEGVRTHRDALRAAASLALAPTRADGEFWNALAVKMVGALFCLAAERGASVVDVTRALEERTWHDWSTGPGDPGARAALDFFARYEPRTLDSVLTTAETLVLAWRFDQPRARVLSVLDGENTLYLCAPRGEHGHYGSLFRGALRAIVEDQQRRADEGEAQPLLLMLDEAATVAALEELDAWAATVAASRITLVTVVQDFAQLRARFGERAATIVNNHAVRLVLAGLADPSADRYVPELAPHPNSSARAWREQPRHLARLVRAHEPPRDLRLVPWWRRRVLRHRGGSLTTLSS